MKVNECSIRDVINVFLQVNESSIRDMIDVFLQVNESSINARRDEQNYEWIVPVDYASNLDDFSDSFILNKSQSKYFFSY